MYSDRVFLQYFWCLENHFANVTTLIQHWFLHGCCFSKGQNSIKINFEFKRKTLFVYQSLPRIPGFSGQHKYFKNDPAKLIYFISWTFLYFIIYCASVRPHGYSQKGDQSSAIVQPGDVTTLTYLLYCLLTSIYYTSSQKFFDKCEHIISNAIFFSSRLIFEMGNSFVYVSLHKLDRYQVPT